MCNSIFKNILVTGGAGFIGSAFIRFILQNRPDLKKVVNLDLLTYAGNLENLSAIAAHPSYVFAQGDILNSPFVEELIRKHQIEAIVHFAAESHVDRSIEDPRAFYRTNVEGTLSLLELVRRFPEIHFHHVSTDEVYGSIESGIFSEESPYSPNSPYAASKAASDHFVRAYAKTYGLSVTLSHSSNNYGPYQYREKFIPRMISSLLKKEALPVYGQGINVRDWLFVEDHAEAIWQILQKGTRGAAYNVAGSFEMRNIDLLKKIIEKFSSLKDESATHYHSLITFVKDRPGHDLRYSLSGVKIEKELGWKPRVQFDEGIEKTLHWYMENQYAWI